MPVEVEWVDDDPDLTLPGLPPAGAKELMDFTFSEEQDAVRDLAAQIFAGHATVERVKEVERSEERVDRELWRALADAGLLAIAVPEEHGGSGLGLVELCLLLEQQGRRVAPVPLWPTLVLGALPIAEFGTPEQQQAWLPGVAAARSCSPPRSPSPAPTTRCIPQVTATRDGDAWRLDGEKPSVPAAHVADRVLVPASTGDGGSASSSSIPPGPAWSAPSPSTTDRSKVAHLAFAGRAG